MTPWEGPGSTGYRRSRSCWRVTVTEWDRGFRAGNTNLPISGLTRRDKRWMWVASLTPVGRALAHPLKPIIPPSRGARYPNSALISFRTSRFAKPPVTVRRGIPATLTGWGQLRPAPRDGPTRELGHELPVEEDAQEHHQVEQVVGAQHARDQHRPAEVFLHRPYGIRHSGLIGVSSEWHFRPAGYIATFRGRGC
jgi:hypothetical protein